MVVVYETIYPEHWGKVWCIPCENTAFVKSAEFCGTGRFDLCNTDSCVFEVAFSIITCLSANMNNF